MLHCRKYDIPLMQKLIIRGKKELTGTIKISGSKNATLPILVASILANDVKLSNVPLVKDIFTMLELLKFIGIKVKMNSKNSTIELKNNFRKINTLAPYKLVKTMRAGVLVLGPLLTKYKKRKYRCLVVAPSAQDRSTYTYLHLKNLVQKLKLKMDI